MKIISNTAIIDGLSFASIPSISGISFIDNDNTKIYIDMKTLVSLYELYKFHLEMVDGLDWKTFTDSLYKK